MTLARRLGTTVAIVISLLFTLSQAVYASTAVGTSDQAAHSYYVDAGAGDIQAFCYTDSVVTKS